jgi:hypothetical protein
MSVTIQKKNGDTVSLAASKKTKTAEPGVLIELVNELGDLHRKMAPLQDSVKEYQKVWKPLFSDVVEKVDVDNDDDKKVSVKTDRYVAAFTEHGNTTAVTDAQAVFKMLDKVEKGLAWKLMGFGITDLRKYLTPKQFDSITETERTKARSITLTYLDED